MFSIIAFKVFLAYSKKNLPNELKITKQNVMVRQLNTIILIRYNTIFVFREITFLFIFHFRNSFILFIFSALCGLYCRVGSLVRGKGTVEDGTRCKADKNTYDVCIQGKCRVSDLK